MNYNRDVRYPPYAMDRNNILPVPSPVFPGLS